MRRLLFFVASSLLVFGVTVFFRLGGHKDVAVSVAERPPLRLLSKEHRGPYHKINDVITTVEAWAAAHGVACKRTFGLYLDDPRVVDERHLRSEGGCLIEGENTIGEIPADFIQKVYPATRYVVAQFDGAPSIGPFKVYPAAEEFMRENKIAAAGVTLEIYTILSEREAATEYLFFIKP